MKTAHDVYKHLCAELSELEARTILKKRAGLEWADLITEPDQPIETKQILKDLEENKNGKPVSRIYGEREFWGLNFEINEHTLDPRPDSETLIERARAYFKDKEPETILDLGTGSGCLLLACLHEFKTARGIGVDLSSEALQAAQKNAKILSLDSRSSFAKTNWADGLDGQYDLVIANPPYIDSKAIPNLEKNVREHDPILALDGGEDGLQAYREIFSRLLSVLKQDGIALFEIGFDQAETVPRLSEKYGLKPGRVHHDLAGNPRVVDIFIK